MKRNQSFCQKSGDSTIFGFSEAWFNDSNDKKLGGGVMVLVGDVTVLVPKILTQGYVKTQTRCFFSMIICFGIETNNSSNR